MASDIICHTCDALPHTLHVYAPHCPRNDVAMQPTRLAAHDASLALASVGTVLVVAGLAVATAITLVSGAAVVVGAAHACAPRDADRGPRGC